MIIDSLENIALYPQISDDVRDFLQKLTPNTKTGNYEITKSAYANIDEYEPKPFEKCKFEAHKKYIDIQMLLSGDEKLDYTPIKGLIISEEYDEKRDVMFFETTNRVCDSVKLENGKFAMIFPHEAHKPQIKSDAEKVKKVVVKIAVN